MFKITLTVFYVRQKYIIEWVETTFNEAVDFAKQLIEPFSKHYTDYELSIERIGD